jgi:hypothetical protein
MNNPLLDFYREKEIYVILPTQGKWYKNKPKLTDDGEIGVMPMTMKDEMLLNIPDSLYNGQSLHEIFKSVVPDIIDPYEISMPDVDVLLLASRAVSNGPELPIDARCPHCDTLTSYSISLTKILSKVKKIEIDTEVEIKKLKIKMRPNSLASVTASSMQSIEGARYLLRLQKDNSEQNQDLIKRSLETATAAGVGVLSDAIESIELPDGTIVTEFEQIVDWVKNLDGASYDILKKLSIKMNDSGIEKTFSFTCGNEECNKEFVAPLEFNPTFFFTRR